MRITLKEIRDALAEVEEARKNSDSFFQLALNTMGDVCEFTIHEYFCFGQYFPMGDSEFIIPSLPDEYDICFAIEASSNNEEYAALLRESLERRTVKFLRKKGIEVI